MMMWLTYEIELSLQSRAPFADLIFQKCAETDSSFNIFKWKLSSCYSLAHLLPIGPDHFFYDLYVKSSSRYGPVHFVDLIFQKCSETASFLRLSSSRYSLVRFLSTIFPDRAAHPRKQSPSFGDHGSQFTRKKYRVLRPRVFSSLN
jgi:hypothetical protein